MKVLRILVKNKTVRKTYIPVFVLKFVDWVE